MTAMTGDEAARALESIAGAMRVRSSVRPEDVVEALALVLGVNARQTPLRALDGPLTDAERAREYRKRKREQRHGVTKTVTGNVTLRDDQRDARHERRDGGTGGNSASGSENSQGKEQKENGAEPGSTDQNVTSPVTDRHEERDARHDKASRPSVTEREDVRVVFDAWRQETGHERAFLDKKRGDRILKRLREGKTKEDLVLAIKNRRNVPHLMGKNETGTVYDGIETLLRDNGQVEKLMAATVAPRAPERVNGFGPRPVQPSHGRSGLENVRVVR